MPVLQTTDRSKIGKLVQIRIEFSRVEGYAIAFVRQHPLAFSSVMTIHYNVSARKIRSIMDRLQVRHEGSEFYSGIIFTTFAVEGVRS